MTTQETSHENTNGAIASAPEEKKVIEDSNSNAPTLNGDPADDSKHEESKEVEAVPAEHNVTPPAVQVPRFQRRGLFGRFTIIAEVEEPKHHSRPIKWFITFAIALAAGGAPLGSSIIFPCLGQIADDLNTSPTVANFSSAFYLLAMAIFPLWWSSFSETMGRRTIYLTSFALFVLWNVLSAVSVNIAMLVVFRILGGGAAASVQAVGAGTIADIWEVRERGKAMGFFYLGPIMGPFFAPIIGGALGQTLGWRSTQWFMAIYAGVIVVLIFFALPETLQTTKPAIPQPAISSRSDQPDLSRATSRSSAAADTTKRWARLLKRFFIEPLFIVLYLRYPPVVITVYWAAITFGSLYILNISIEATFSQSPYNFPVIIIGLLYIPASIGYILTSILGGRWSDRIMAREARRAGRYTSDGKLAYRPEDRMRENAWMAALMYPGGLIWYGWTVEKDTFWLVPLLGTFFFGVGTMLVFGLATTMLTEFMPRKASSGVALNNLIRCTVSFIGAIVAQPLIEALGNGWLFTIVGLITGASSLVVWIMRRFGPKWRERMVRELG